MKSCSCFSLLFCFYYQSLYYLLLVWIVSFVCVNSVLIPSFCHSASVSPSPSPSPSPFSFSFSSPFDKKQKMSLRAILSSRGYSFISYPHPSTAFYMKSQQSSQSRRLSRKHINHFNQGNPFNRYTRIKFFSNSHKVIPIHIVKMSGGNNNNDPCNDHFNDKSKHDNHKNQNMNPNKNDAFHDLIKNSTSISSSLPSLDFTLDKNTEREAKDSKDLKEGKETERQSEAIEGWESGKGKEEKRIKEKEMDKNKFEGNITNNNSNKDKIKEENMTIELEINTKMNVEKSQGEKRISEECKEQARVQAQEEEEDKTNDEEIVKAENQGDFAKVSPYETLPVIFPSYRIRHRNPLRPTRYDPYQYNSHFHNDASSIEMDSKVRNPQIVKKPSKSLTFPKGCTLLFALDTSRMYFAEHGIPDPNLSARYLLGHALTLEAEEKEEQQQQKELQDNDSNKKKPGQVKKKKKSEREWKLRDPWDMDTTQTMSDRSRDFFLRLCAERMQRVPVQYLVGNWDFHDITIDLRPPILIPRPETEEMVEELVTQIKKQHHEQISVGEGEVYGSDHLPLRILDVGCGSGAIGLSLLKAFPKATCVAIDINQEAVDLSLHNSKQLALDDRYFCFQSSIQDLDFSNLQFIQNNILRQEGLKDNENSVEDDKEGLSIDLENVYTILVAHKLSSLLKDRNTNMVEMGELRKDTLTSLKTLSSFLNKKITEVLKERQKSANTILSEEQILALLLTTPELTTNFDIIVSNPPYIPRTDMLDLMAEVIKYEYYHALFGGDDDGGFIIKEILKKTPTLLDDSSSYSWCWLETDSSHSQSMEDWVALSSIQNALEAETNSLPSSSSSSIPSSSLSSIEGKEERGIVEAARYCISMMMNSSSSNSKLEKLSPRFGNYLALEKYYTDLSKNPRYCFLKMKKGLLLESKNDDNDNNNNSNNQ